MNIPFCVLIGKHMKVHSGIDYPCKIEGCNFITRFKQSLAKHMLNVHNLDKDMNPVEPYYKCTLVWN